MLAILPLYIFLFTTPPNFASACTCSLSRDGFTTPHTQSNVNLSLKCINCSEIPTYPNASSITQLDLGGNPLIHLTPSTFSQKGFVSLKKINLSNCRIMDIDQDTFLGLQIIYHLDLSYNSLSSINLNTSAVKTLNLRGNPIKNLDFNKHLLDEIDLSNCSLDRIPPNRPFLFSSLKKINLDSNKLTTLPWSEVRATDLRHISLKENPWRCDCHMHFLEEDLHNVYHINTEDDVVCDSPPKLRGLGLDSITREIMDELPCPLQITEMARVKIEDRITLNCWMRGRPQPLVQWHQGTVDVGNLLQSQPAEPTFFIAGERYQYKWKSTLEILPNNSAYQGPWTFWCTAQNQFDIARAQITLTARLQFYVHIMTPAAAKIASVETLSPNQVVSAPQSTQRPSIVPFLKTEPIPPISISNDFLSPTTADDPFIRQMSIVICTLVVIPLLFLVALIVLVD
ncbi:SLIT and NTRK-like protein 5 [Folsomia candida]|uniref:SLIT and NTRK-like protein 5 n=2 Tax=Folsomia candida TaxID=158441 RepID=A0A226E7X8_FOLCA|nr:SLIT and NTRK-like protein 5 [Folsomia candida]